jgi:hypothetical protein
MNLSTFPAISGVTDAIDVVASLPPMAIPGLLGRFMISCASITNFFQIEAGRVPPTTPFVAVPSSLPIQTPTMSESVKPINQASR